MCFWYSRGLPSTVENERSDHESSAATRALSGRPETGASKPACRKLLQELTGRGAVTRVRTGAMTWPLKSGSSIRLGGSVASTRQTGSDAPTNDSRNTSRAYTRPAFQRSLYSIGGHPSLSSSAVNLGSARIGSKPGNPV
jgi:hypothetical protein